MTDTDATLNTEYHVHSCACGVPIMEESIGHWQQATITALREALERCRHLIWDDWSEVDAGGKGLITRSEVEAVLTDTAPAAAQERERIEAPWRALLTEYVNDETPDMKPDDMPTAQWDALVAAFYEREEKARALLASEDVT